MTDKKDGKVPRLPRHLLDEPLTKEQRTQLESIVAGNIVAPITFGIGNIRNQRRAALVVLLADDNHTCQEIADQVGLKAKSAVYRYIDMFRKENYQMIEQGNYLQQRFDNYAEIVYAYAEDVFERVVKPYLDQHRYHFVAGMGSFLIFNPRIPTNRNNYADQIDVDDDNFPKDVREALEAEVPGMDGNNLGSLMPDYEPWEYYKKGSKLWKMGQQKASSQSAISEQDTNTEQP